MNITLDFKLNRERYSGKGRPKYEDYDVIEIYSNDEIALKFINGLFLEKHINLIT